MWESCKKDIVFSAFKFLLLLKNNCYIHQSNRPWGHGYSWAVMWSHFSQPWTSHESSHNICDMVTQADFQQTLLALWQHASTYCKHFQLRQSKHCIISLKMECKKLHYWGTFCCILSHIEPKLQCILIIPPPLSHAYPWIC